MAEGSGKRWLVSCWASASGCKVTEGRWRCKGDSFCEIDIRLAEIEDVRCWCCCTAGKGFLEPSNRSQARVPVSCSKSSFYMRAFVR